MKEQKRKVVEFMENNANHRVVKAKACRRCEAAICFARMYGIKETLEPLEFRKNEDVISIVLQWVDMYLKADCPNDITAFFEAVSEEMCRQ